MRVPVRDGRENARSGRWEAYSGAGQAIRRLMSDTLNPNLPEDVQNDDDLDFAALVEQYDQRKSEIRDC